MSGRNTAPTGFGCLAIPRKRPGHLAGLGEALLAMMRQPPPHDSTEDAFASEFARYVGAARGVAVGGARVGLWELMRWVRGRHGPGEVVVSALTASIVPNVVLAAGFDLRFVDCDPRTFNADADALLAAVGPRTRAVITTHLEGFPVRADRVAAALAGSGVLVIEDAAHALGARVDGRLVGSLADAAIFSLGKGKQLNAIDGGVVTTARPELADALLAARSRACAPTFGKVARKVAVLQAMRAATHPLAFDVALWPGLHACALFGHDPLVEFFEDDRNPPGPAGPSAARVRLGAPQAVFGRRGLDAYPALLARRRALWGRFREAAARGGVETQSPIVGTEPAPLEVAIRPRDRGEALRALRRLGIDAQPTWMVSPATLPAFVARDAGRSPAAEALEASLVYLPFYPDLREREVQRIEAVLSNPPPGLRP